jgi:hypothetical protein
MIGKNPLWVAKQHGHSVQTMLEVYAADTNTDPLEAPGFATKTPPEHPRPGATCGTERKNTGGERGIRTGLRVLGGSVTY